LWLSETLDEHVHDKKIAGEQPPLLPSGITLWHDTGFIGHNSGNVTVKMPTEKPKGKDLSEKQKQKSTHSKDVCKHPKPVPCVPQTPHSVQAESPNPLLSMA
jgi:hypothetical protein